MTIKSLLLGSAAALLAVSGARAADAVVMADPEPVEYVRVCDVYGTGFYYIPGTETCLRVGGYIRYDIGVGDFPTYGWGVDLDGDLEGDTYYKRARAQLVLDSRSETELGTLRGFAAINFNYDRNGGGTGNSVSVNDAYIELGGFRIGKTDSLFSTFTGYAGGVIADDLGVPYGPFDTHQIVYTFTGGNGFSAAVGLEEGGAGFALTDYVPHVVAGVGFTQGWGGVSAVAGYDSVTEEWAAKARLDVKFGDTISAFLMGGYSSNDGPGRNGNYIDAPNNFYAQWQGDWAVWGGVTAKVSEKATINFQAQYDEDENLAASLNVAYELVPGLVITPEIEYADTPDFGDGFGGIIRFQRNF